MGGYESIQTIFPQLFSTSDSVIEIPNKKRDIPKLSTFVLEVEEPSEVQDVCFLAFAWFIFQDSDVADS